MSVAEVAEVLELSFKSVESLLFRGKQALRKSLKEES
jgi:DNA-directed RNA polymerase specialized sigma24 family protein